MKKNIVFVSKETPSSKKVYDSLSHHNLLWVKEGDNLIDFLKDNKPDWVVVFHWSHIISREIHQNYRCITMHTGNLPDDKGGSPIQNQIINGKKFSKVNVIELTDPVDSGGVYCSKSITLQGSLFDIWDVISSCSIELIKKCIEENLLPERQIGDSKTYKRKLNNKLVLNSIESVYDQIRMLDGYGYPKTYLESDGFIFEFSRATLFDDKVLSDVKIYKK